MTEYRHNVRQLNGVPMYWRMGLVTLLLLVATGCSVPGFNGSESGPKTPNEETSTETTRPPESAGPSEEPESPGKESIDADSIVGDWSATDADWQVHFHSDGTYTEDFQGHDDFRVGKYKVAGDEVKLIGDDGYSNVGSVTDDGTIKFKLGTLQQEE